MATTRLLRQAGFILRNAREAGARGLPAVDAGFMCLFAIDGSTAAGRPLPHYGCEHRKDVLPVNFPQPSAMHRNIEFAWGQCEAAGILTHEQWVDFRQGYPDTESSWAQCSWNVDRPEAWDHAILEHRLYGAIAEDFYIWNELLLRITDDGSMLKDKIAAFFYDPNFKYEEGESLPQAQNFQRKLDAHGYQVPVLRVDFKAPASQRFSYHPEDQVIPLW
ncbi:hypothetical protein [Dyella sp.]|uniref:hypothetical protein n=1 Tax=Dyella sp. TaxID=1869338 RepID=UPI002ED3CCAE